MTILQPILTRSLQKLVLDYLGVEQLAAVLGGSMGGATALEWPLCFPVRNPPSRDAILHVSADAKPYVRSIVALAASARHSAWCIAWCEIQRQAIAADSRFRGGRYLLREPPNEGLAAARMCALMTYRQPDSFERRFSRMRGTSNLKKQEPAAPTAPGVQAQASSLMEEGGGDTPNVDNIRDPQAREQYAVQSYLHYHGTKFLSRFDANCYVHLSDKLDSHDVGSERHSWVSAESTDDCAILAGTLRFLGDSPVSPRVLVLSVTSDQLYTAAEQQFIADSIPRSKLVHIQSAEGHDGFLLEYPQIYRAMGEFLQTPKAPL